MNLWQYCRPQRRSNGYVNHSSGYRRAILHWVFFRVYNWEFLQQKCVFEDVKFGFEEDLTFELKTSRNQEYSGRVSVI